MASFFVYDVGDTVKVTATFKVDGAMTDPTTLTVAVKLDGAAKYTLTYGVDAALTRDSLGQYTARIDCTDAGQWSLYFQSTGAAKGAESTIFRVQAPP